MIDAFEEETFEEGKDIIKQGENGENFYLIVTGLCGREVKHPNGKTFIHKTRIYNVMLLSYTIHLWKHNERQYYKANDMNSFHEKHK